MSDIEKTPDTAPKELLDSIRTIADENTAEAIHEAIADAPDQEEAPPSIDVSADEAPAENAPADSADYCVDCPHKDTCTYSAKRIYIDPWHWAAEPAYAGP